MADTLVQEEPPTKPQGAMWKKRVWLAVVILLNLVGLASVLYMAIEANIHWFQGGDIVSQAHAYAIGDIDQAVYLKHVQQHWSFLSTFAWWHQACVYPDLPRYWRPLTMLGFWSECHLFGAYRFDRWQAAEIVFFVLFAVLLAWFAYRITGSRVAPAITLLGLSSFAPLLGMNPVTAPFLAFFTSFTNPDANVVLINWKDQAEIWAGAATLGALIFTLNARWWAALACTLVAIGFKESGWLVFPMILVLLVITGKLRSVPRSIWIASAVSSVLLLALRASAGRDTFLGKGGHAPHAWFSRYALSVTDQNLHLLATSSWVLPILAFSLAWLIVVSRRSTKTKLIAGAVLLVVACVLFGLANGQDPTVGIALILDPKTGLFPLISCLVYGIALLLAWRSPAVRRQIVAIYALVLLSALATTAVLQPNQHMLFLTNAFQCTLVAAVAVAAGRELLAIFNARQKAAPAPAAEAA